MEEEEFLPRLFHHGGFIRADAGGEPLAQRRFAGRSGVDRGHGEDRENRQELPMNRNRGREFTAEHCGGVLEFDRIGVNTNRAAVRLMGSGGVRRYFDERTVRRVRSIELLSRSR